MHINGKGESELNRKQRKARDIRKSQQEELVEDILDGMDMKCLLVYAAEQLNDYFDTLTDAELHEEYKAQLVEEGVPHVDS